jgi:O-acetyl-ADP-ribose deacetylase
MGELRAINPQVPVAARNSGCNGVFLRGRPMSNADACHWMLRLKIMQGDITKQKVDAIVNAANESLLGGGGVDGAIHQSAGPELLAECRLLNGCETGQAKITKGYKLPARYVIHTVGPVWQGGKMSEDQLLASCYRSCLELVETYELRSIAFPAISTGAYRFPIDRAAEIALGEIKPFLQRSTTVERLLVVCFGQEVYDAYWTVLHDLVPE